MKFRHFLKEIFRGKTIGRAMLFGELKDLFEKEKWLNDKFVVLELGSEPASHQRTFSKDWALKKSNYIQTSNIDFVINAEEKFSFKDQEFDGVVFFNVLYALKNWTNCLEESSRISKNFTIFNIPLISGIARHPNDFNRFPEDKLVDILENLKSKKLLQEYKIIPIGGSFTSAISLIDPFLKFRIIRIPVYLCGLLFDKLDKPIKRQCPMQYLVLIKKQ